MLSNKNFIDFYTSSCKILQWEKHGDSHICYFCFRSVDHHAYFPIHLRDRPSGSDLPVSIKNDAVMTKILRHTYVTIITWLQWCSRIGKCHASPAIGQRQDAKPLCMTCGDECNKCEFGFITSTFCGIPQCRKVSDNAH